MIGVERRIESPFPLTPFRQAPQDRRRQRGSGPLDLTPPWAVSTARWPTREALTPDGLAVSSAQTPTRAALTAPQLAPRAHGRQQGPPQ